MRSTVQYHAVPKIVKIYQTTRRVTFPKGGARAGGGVGAAITQLVSQLRFVSKIYLLGLGKTPRYHSAPATGTFSEGRRFFSSNQASTAG